MIELWCAVRAEEIDQEGGLVVIMFGGGVMEVVFAVDGGEGTEEEVASIGHDGGAAGRDGVVSLLEEQAGKEVVDVGSGLKFSEITEKGGCESGGVARAVARCCVTSTEARGGAVNVSAAMASGGSAVLAARQALGGDGGASFVFHFGPR